MNLSILNQIENKPSYEDANYYLHAEFSIFGKLENGAEIDDFDFAMRGNIHEHTRNANLSNIEIKSIY